MAYQIPNKTKALFLLQETEVEFYKLRTQNLIVPNQPKLTHATVTMFIKGLIGQDFKMKMKVYESASMSNVLFESAPISNLDIQRSTDLYCELRFDFPAAIMGVGKQHLVTFEIYDGYTYDNDNYVAIILEALGSQGFLGADNWYDLVSISSELGARCSFFFSHLETSTENFYLCRIQGSRLLNASDFEYTEYQFFPLRALYETYLPKNLYIKEITFTYSNFGSKTITNINNATEQFKDLFPDEDNLDFFKNFFYYNPETGYLKIYSDQSVNQTSYCIIEYYMFFSEDRGRYIPYNLENGWDLVYWEPRLPRGFTAEMSQQNNLQGLLSVSSAPLNLKNQDGFFNSFFSTKDCFSNREVKIWRCEGSFMTKTVEFKGVIRSADITDSECTFGLADPLARLDDQYTDNRPLTLLELAQAGAYWIRTVDVEKPVSRMLGKISSHSYTTKYTGQDLNIPWFHYEKMINCSNVNVNFSPTTSNNRTWSVGFGPISAATQQRDVTAVANYTSGTFSATKFTINNVSGPISEWLPPGTCIVNNGQYGIVYASNDTEAYVWPHNASFSAAHDIIRHKVISVIVERDGSWGYALAGRDYTCQIGAAGDLQIVFTNNFEAAMSLPSALDPINDGVYAVMMDDVADGRASKIVFDCLVQLGMEVNMSFEPDQSPAWTDAELAMTIPFPGESRFPQMRDVVELAMRSGLGMLYFGQEGYLRYNCFLRPFDISPFMEDITQKNSANFAVSFDLWDLYGGVVYDFTHCKRYDTWSVQYDMVKDFYKTQNLYYVETAIDPTRKATYDFLNDYAHLVMGRPSLFRIDALAEQMGLYIGSDINISRKRLIGDETSSPLRVVSIGKSVNKSSFSLLDLKKFPTL